MDKLSRYNRAVLMANDQKGMDQDLNELSALVEMGLGREGLDKPTFLRLAEIQSHLRGAQQKLDSLLSAGRLRKKTTSSNST